MNALRKWRKAGRLVVLLVVLSPAVAARAWNSPGHMIIAAEAYRELPPKLQKRAVEILKGHPEYKNWERSYSAEEPGLDPGLFIFMRAATWPDEIRESHGEFNHPHWHFVDYPLQPPKFRLEPEPSPDDDALYGIALCEKMLAKSKTTPELRAVYLAYLIHLVGDLHQPLHCATLVSETYPKGDKGGNDFFIKPATRGISLHSFWDGLLGRSSNLRSQENEAVRLEAEYPRKSLSELGKAKTPRAWSLESRDIAIEKGYLRGKLPGGVSEETAPSPPSDYAKAAKETAERRAALAGYRLADEIQRYVK